MKNSSHFMQTGQMIQCGHCNPIEFGEGLKQALLISPNLFCNCNCHSCACSPEGPGHFKGYPVFDSGYREERMKEGVE